MKEKIIDVVCTILVWGPVLSIGIGLPVVAIIAEFL